MGLWCTALLPFGLAVVVHTVGAAPQPVRSGVEPPPLAFEQYAVNLGPVPPMRRVPARFTFRNAGEKPIRIESLEPSCGCLNPRLEKRDYAPGETGEFFLVVDTPGEKPGVKEYTVKVRYTAPEPHEELLTFRVTLPERQVVVEPKALVFYQLSNRTTTQEVAVIDFRQQPLTITSVSCSSELVTARVASSGEDEEGNRRHLILIRVDGNTPPGRTRALVTLHTDDAAYRELEVPLLIEGSRNGSAPAAPGRDNDRDGRPAAP